MSAYHRRAGFIILLVVSVFLTGCVATKGALSKPPPNVEYAPFPQMKVGDSWTYLGRSEVYGSEGSKKYKFTIVEVKKNGGFVLEVKSLDGNGTYLEYYDNKHRLVKILDFFKGEEVMQTRSTLSPPTQIKFPLFVGLKWKEDYIARSVLNAANTIKIRNNYEVVDYEHIEINGKFEKAFRIDRTIRPISGSSQTYSQTYWYAPRFKRIVLINSSYTTPIKMLSFTIEHGEGPGAGHSLDTAANGKAEIDRTPPRIKILSPESNDRGLAVQADKKKTRIKGMATDRNGVVEVTVDGRDAKLSEAGFFIADAYLGVGVNNIMICATDRYGNRSSETIRINRKSSEVFSETKPVPYSQNYAIIIGNNDYRFLSDLETARNDASAIASILKGAYDFKTELLLDANRTDILQAMNRIRRRIRPNDSLLIYYAGHGIFDKTTNKAYWLPVDAMADDDTNWIIVDTVTSNTRRMPAKHVLIVADSCYSGAFTRKSPEKFEVKRDRLRYLKKMRSKKSRTLMASGGNEPVADTGGGNHSVFAAAFIDGLEKAPAEQYLAEELFFNYIKERVAGSALQTPEYRVIRNSGHEGGDFIFSRAK